MHFIKIFDTESSLNNGNNKLIGVLNINNMIPVASSVIQKYNLVPTANDTPQKRAEKRLRAKQLNWCREHSDTIYNRANKVYKIVTETPEKSRNLVRRCCDFKKLRLVLKFLSDYQMYNCCLFFCPTITQKRDFV